MLVSYVGYESQQRKIVVTSGREVVQNVQMTQSFVQSEEVVVTASKNTFQPINESAVVSSQMFTVDQVERYAGARNDPAKMAQNFAGVMSVSDERNDIVIRGGSPTELLWMMDGLMIPNPNHFATQGATGGPISALNSRLLDNSDFLTGAFPAEYGGRLSGVFDLNTRSGNRDRYEYIGQFGFNGFEFGAEGPIGGDASFIANYRYSFLDFVVNTLGVDFSFAGVPRYDDANFKLDWDIDQQNSLALTGIFARSNIAIQQSEQDDVFRGDEDVNNGTDLLGIALNYKYLHNDKFYTKFLLGGVFNQFQTEVFGINTDQNGNVLEILPWIDNQSMESYVGSKFTAYYAPDSRNYFTAGIEARYRFYELDYNYTPVDFMGEITPYFADGNTMQYLSFINWNYRASENFTINSGLFSQHLALSGKTTIEPRLGLQYRLNDEHSLNAGFGVHTQMLPLQLYFGFDENNDLDFMQSIHYIAGWTWNLATDWQIKIEGYYKDLSNIPVEADELSSWSFLNAGANYGDVGVNGILAQSTGTGEVYGTELSLTKHFSDHYYITLTTSIMEQKYSGSDGIERNGAFDNGFVANLLFGYEFVITDDFTMEFSAKIITAGGTPYTPIDIAESMQTGRTERLNQLAFSERNPIYNKTDLRVDFRQNFNGWAIISFFSVENAFNQENILTRTWDRRNAQIQPIYQLGFFPIGGVRIEF